MGTITDRMIGRTPTEVDGLPERATRGRAAERILAAEELAELRRWVQTQTEAMERLTGRVVNHVLETGLFQIPASGDLFVTFAWHMAAGIVQIRNLSAANTMTVTSDAPQTGGASTTGHGVWRVPAASKDIVPVASHRITVYGTAGDLFNLAALSSGPIAAAI
jgi:hypothetical protein